MSGFWKRLYGSTWTWQNTTTRKRSQLTLVYCSCSAITVACTRWNRPNKRNRKRMIKPNTRQVPMNTASIRNVWREACPNPLKSAHVMCVCVRTESGVQKSMWYQGTAGRGGHQYNKIAPPPPRKNSKIGHLWTLITQTPVTSIVLTHIAGHALKPAKRAHRDSRISACPSKLSKRLEVTSRKHATVVGTQPVPWTYSNSIARE